MKTRSRKIDNLTRDAVKKSKNLVLVKKTKVFSWKTAIPTAFVFGLFATVGILVYFKLQTMSDASIGASSIFLYPQTFTNLSAGSTFTTTAFVDTKGNNAVAVGVNISYDPTVLQLLNYDLSSSAFANSACIYNGAPCQIIENNAAAGKISITLGKPSPGLNTTSGEIVKLKFQALKPATSSKIQMNYIAGDYNDSNVILDDSLGTDILNFVDSAYVTIGSGSTCNNLSFVSGTALPASVSQNATYTMTCDYGMGGINSIKANNDLGSCTWTGWNGNGAVFSCNAGSAGTRINTCSLISGTTSNSCPKVNPINNVTVTATAVTCTNFVYSSWSRCVNGKQTRTIVARYPNGCTGGLPVLSQNCKVRGKKN